MPSYLDHSQSNAEFTVNVTITNKSNNETRRIHDYDEVATPPPYDSLRHNYAPHGSSSTERSKSAPRKEWDAVAARIATRTAGARNAAKRLSSTYSSNRVEKPSPRRHKAAGLSIDTSVARPRPSPKQMFPKESRKQQASGYTRLAESSIQTQRAPSSNFTGSTLVPAASRNDAPLVSTFSPETPTILITPALDQRVSPEQRSRVASSIYSRMTSGATPPTQAGDVPPLPQNLPELLKKSQPLMPTHAQDDRRVRESSGTAFEEDFDEKKYPRITSNATLFEEDQYQGNSQLRAAQHAHEQPLDSALLPTPRRSKGWWNVIRTPFLKSPTDGERTPDVPPIPQAAYYTQTSPDDALGLKFAPRNTHNSQALRRLESKDHLHAEPVPPLPTKRNSAHSTFSPNDREVPLMLHVSPVEKKTIANTAATSTTGNLQLPFQSNGTPESARSEFSPVGQLMGEGQVFAAKGVVQNPTSMQTSTQSSNQATFVPRLQAANTSSLRSSLTAEVLKTSPPQAPVAALQPGSRQAPAAAPYFAPPPTYPYESVQDPQRGHSPNKPARPFPPTRFSSYDALSEKKEKKSKLKGLLTRKSGKHGDQKSKKSKRRRWCCAICCVLIFLLIILGIVLGVVLGRNRNSSLSDQVWFNITNYPPVPGGVLTVARPNLRTSVSGCVNPQAMWSCAVPKEQQEDIKPNEPTQPNFVFDIRLDNTSIPSSKLRRSGSVAPRVWQSLTLLRRDSPVLQASPKPPTLDEYKFLGNTTDNINEPFEGEETPFYISFKPPSQTDFKKVKRHELEFDSTHGTAVSAAATTTTVVSSATTSVIVVPDLQTTFPKPQINSDGTAQAANLLPFPSFQPLRLFNRGTPDEHYGFYTYFERSIFLRSVTFQNSSEQLSGDIPADANGGSTQDAAISRCTWTDTRFKVQIFTNKGKSAEVLTPLDGETRPEPGSVTFVRPGSFPYPITITLDRHGGGATTKMLFCYGMDDRGVIDINARKIQPEDRAFGGSIVNPSQAFVDSPVTVPQGGPGGIDGGSGGCMCEWVNWLSK